MSQVRIDRRLKISFAGMAAIATALGVGWWVSSDRLASLLDTSIHHTAANVEKINEVRAGAMQLRVAQRGVILYSIMNQPGRVRDNVTLFRDTVSKIGRLVKEIRATETEVEAVNAVAEIEGATADWMPHYEHVEALTKAEQYGEELGRTVDSTFACAKRLDNGVAALIAVQKKDNEEAEAAAASTTKMGKFAAGGLMALSLLVSAGVLLTVVQISRVLRNTAHLLGNACEQIAGAAGHISDSSQTLAQGASQQAASLEEASASAEEINSMSRRSAQHSEEANVLSRAAAVKLNEGAKALEGMRTSMDRVAQSSQSIGKIIKVIDDIAFQTNILALNAAVEAARAGSAGAGFAVVAEEVRNLAQRSAAAASETSGLIEEAVNRSQQAKESLEGVSVRMAEATSEALRVTKFVEEIHAGSQQQADGVELIATAVVRIQEVTQKNAASAEEAAAATEELNAQAAAMRDMVTDLQGMVGR